MNLFGDYVQDVQVGLVVHNGCDRLDQLPIRITDESVW